MVKRGGPKRYRAWRFLGSGEFLPEPAAFWRRCALVALALFYGLFLALWL
jgi:hypothetical protein